MRYIEIDGMRLSRIGLGTWQFATREWGYGEEYARVTAPALIRRAGRSSMPGSGVFARPQGRMASRRPGIDALREAIDEVASAHGTTPAQVSLAWVLAHPNTVAIPGARTIQQLEDNAAAADLELEDGEVRRLTTVASLLGGPE
jgi:aryl-alcohol dehydrogenase-like predicted oxidoreductase